MAKCCLYPNMNRDTIIELTVPAQELVDDDRYGWIAQVLAPYINMCIHEIASDGNKTIDETIWAANILFNEGFIEITRE